MEKLTVKEVRQKMEEFNKQCISCKHDTPNKRCSICLKLTKFSEWYQSQPIRIQL